MLPRKVAPSAIATRGAAISPSTEPSSRMLIRSEAAMLPVTSPITTMDFADTCALSFALEPIVSTCSLRSTFPSTRPSMVRSSFPLNSPLTTIDLPIVTTAGPDDVTLFSPRRLSTSLDKGFAPDCGSIFNSEEPVPSSRFHIAAIRAPILRHRGHAGAELAVYGVAPDPV